MRSNLIYHNIIKDNLAIIQIASIDPLKIFLPYILFYKTLGGFSIVKIETLKHQLSKFLLSAHFNQKFHLATKSSFLINNKLFDHS